MELNKSELSKSNNTKIEHQNGKHILRLMVLGIFTRVVALAGNLEIWKPPGLHCPACKWPCRWPSSRKDQRLCLQQWHWKTLVMWSEPLPRTSPEPADTEGDNDISRVFNFNLKSLIYFKKNKGEGRRLSFRQPHQSLQQFCTPSPKIWKSLQFAVYSRKAICRKMIFMLLSSFISATRPISLHT